MPHIANWKITIFIGKSSITGPFSIVMLVYMQNERNPFIKPHQQRQGVYSRRSVGVSLKKTLQLHGNPHIPGYLRLDMSWSAHQLVSLHRCCVVIRRQPVTRRVPSRLNKFLGRFQRAAQKMVVRKRVDIGGWVRHGWKSWTHEICSKDGVIWFKMVQCCYLTPNADDWKWIHSKSGSCVTIAGSGNTECLPGFTAWRTTW